MALLVSPETFAVVLFPEGEVPAADLISCGCMPLDERSFLAPEGLRGELPSTFQVIGTPWRRVEVRAPFANSEVLAAAASALAEVDVSVLVWARAQGFWLFVPEKKLGRALAALRQARLERFASKL